MVTLTTVNRPDYSIEIDQKWSNYKEELTKERVPIFSFVLQLIFFLSRFYNRTRLPARKFRAAVHDLDISGIAEQAVSLLGSQFFNYANLLQVPKSLIYRRRGDACLLY